MFSSRDGKRFKSITSENDLEFDTEQKSEGIFECWSSALKFSAGYSSVLPTYGLGSLSPHSLSDHDSAEKILSPLVLIGIGESTVWSEHYLSMLRPPLRFLPSR